MPGGGGNWKPSHNPWFIAVAVMIATFMEVMDTSIASVAVPYIAGSTASTNNQAEWVLTVYLVANAVFLPSSAWFAEKFGRKRYLMTSVLVFTIASFACGVAPNLPFILFARAVQGAAGGALQPLSQAILIESFPPAKRGMALGFFALGIVVAPVVGPAFGGYLTDAISWRWAFYINIPIGIVALILQNHVLEDPPYLKDAKPPKLDGIGFGLLGIWIACMQFILDKGQEDDWFGDSKIRWAAVIMTVGLIAFLIREFKTKNPLVNLRALANRNLGIGCALVFVLGAAIYAFTTIMPVFFQTLMGYDATAAGLAVSPRGIGAMTGSLVVGYLTSKLDPRPLVSIGFGILSYAAFWTGLLTLDISPTSLFWPLAVSGFGMSAIFVPLSGLALGTLSPQQIGNASGIYNLLRNIGGSVGISAANTIVQRHAQTHRNQMVHWLSGGNWIMQKQIQMLTAEMARHAGPRRATLRAYAMTQTSLDNQSQYYAYIDDFRYLGLLCALCVPLAFLMKKAASKQGSG